MLFSNAKSIALTLFVYAVLANAHIHQPNHVNLKRLMKKRAPLPQDDVLTVTPVANAGGILPTFATTSSTSSVASVATSVSQSSTTLTASDSLASSLSSSASSSSSDSTISSSASVTNTSSLISSTSVTSTSTVPTSTAAPATTADPVAVTANSNPTTTQSKSVVTLTTSVGATPTDSVTPEAAANASAPKTTVVTALIIAASSVAAITILWTVFRKWKFGRSSKFDERLQPIDWRPTADDDEPLPGHHRRHSAASSFRSAGHPSANDHGSSDHGHNSPSSYTLPDHDFTAGPAHLAPIGGYADLARGPSPQPQMTQARGPASLSRPAYDVGVPLHHQGYGI
ncbi:hypothetical protein H0H92_003502 [Tricholoma furcatifolium]|nr:hypothetical protein H0H92_003502 [Tricholoma furcatifolium]